MYGGHALGGNRELERALDLGVVKRVVAQELKKEEGAEEEVETEDLSSLLMPKTQ